MWLYCAGRGSGKTRTGAEYIRARVKEGYDRIAMIAPTAADARDVMVEGESGIMAVCWEGDRDCKGRRMGRPLYEPSKRRLTWANGAIATTYSADEPERLRGPQSSCIWADELASWRYPETWDMAMFGLRLGKDPRCFVSTTPKPVKLVRDLMKSPTTVITRGSTFDNRANLAPAFLDVIVRKYEGTRLGRQELYAELLDEASGALWKRNQIENNRVQAVPELQRIVVAIDPAVTHDKDSDETGIVVAALGRDGHGYVLEDLSGRYSPDEWARKAIGAYDRWKADRIIGEANNGGEMIQFTLRTTAQAMKRDGIRTSAELSYRAVHASRGKQARAEPIAALFEQNRVHHVGMFPELEDQMSNWEPLSGAASPDRVDALVWGIHELMLLGASPLVAPVCGPAFNSFPSARY